jgi:hypothetical protein
MPVGVTELVVGAVTLRRVHLAATARRAADVVLTAERARMQRAKVGELLLDGRDAVVDLALGHEGAVAKNQKYCEVLFCR